MLELLRQRRSVRSYQAQPLEADKVKLLEEALLRAPTSRNRQPCEFVLVEDRATLRQLAKAKKHGTTFFESAPLAVVITADPRVSDVWIEDSAIAAFALQMAAEELGLKSCWAQLRLRPHDEALSASAFVRQLVGIPQELEVPMAIAVGYPEQAPAGHPHDSLRQEKIHHTRYEDAHSS